MHLRSLVHFIIIIIRYSSKNINNKIIFLVPLTRRIRHRRPFVPPMPVSGFSHIAAYPMRAVLYYSRLRHHRRTIVSSTVPACACLHAENPRPSTRRSPNTLSPSASMLPDPKRPPYTQNNGSNKKKYINENIRPLVSL